jgi:hypothetical protein
MRSLGLIAFVCLLLISTAHSADLRCDAPGIAAALVPDIFANNPAAKKLGIAVSGVAVLEVEETSGGPVCLVSVKTDHGYTLRYRLHVAPTCEATLDLAG